MIPTELGSLANLEVLSLSDNQLSGVVPQTLAGLSMLESFSFYNNLGLCAPVDDAFQTWLRGISIVYGSSCAPADADSPADRVVLRPGPQCNGRRELDEQRQLAERGAFNQRNGTVSRLMRTDGSMACSSETTSWPGRYQPTWGV